MAASRFVFASLVLAGCVGDELDVDSTSQAVTAAGERVIGNGVSLNGVSLNGVSLNGVSLNGVSLNGVSLNGVSLNGVSLNGVSLNGVSLNGPTLTAGGTPLVGTIWNGQLSNGSALGLRIDAIAPGAIPIYTVSYATTAGWQNLCGAGGTALAVAGTWDYSIGTRDGGSYDANDRAFTFACRGHAIAKCVELGYQPWLGRKHELASCTRALRADFCGDGTSYTVDGTIINIYDRGGIQADTEAWATEAAWSPRGATCIDEPEATRFAQVVGITPACAADLERRCDGFQRGALIRTELPPIDE